jgi:type VI secretion system secreted protein Hcp
MAFDAFLKIEGIPGESTDDNHLDWIELHSFSHGLLQRASGSASSGGARTSQRCDHEDFVVVKDLDKASPKLALYCCNGTHIPEITLELCRATGEQQKYMEYVLRDVIVSSVRPTGNPGGEAALPQEEVAFNYAKIEWTYTELDHETGASKGNITAHWDQVKNTGG